MIALVGASSILLMAAQASMNASSAGYWACAKQQQAKAESEKVAGEAFEAYLRNACKSQIEALQAAITALDEKHGMASRAAVNDARQTVDSYLSDPVRDYKFEMSQNVATEEPASAPAKPPVAQQQASSQPTKP